MTSGRRDCLYTVVLCVYNRPDAIIECLRSVAAQTLGDGQIVVVDDGSTDATPHAVARWIAAHPGCRVDLVRNQVNLGVGAARNAGIDAAEGEWIAFTDSDCTAEPGWVEALIGHLSALGLDAAGGTVIEAQPRGLGNLCYRGNARVGAGRLQGRWLVGGNMAFRAEVLRRYRFDPDIRYGADEDELCWRLRRDGVRVGFAPSAVVHHNHHFSVPGYLRAGWLQGRGAARFWRKRGIWFGRDVILVVAMFATLPLALAGWPEVPAVFALLQFAAVVYNEWVFKDKGLATALLVAPVAFLHTATKGASAVLAHLTSIGGRARTGAGKRARRETPPSAQ